MVNQETLAQIPSVDKILIHPKLEPWRNRLQHDLLVDRIRGVVDEFRAQLIKSKGEESAPDEDAIVRRVEQELTRLMTSNLGKVINASGIILHTGLGRAPWSQEARDAAAQVIEGYTNLEIDLQTGDRGERLNHIDELICLLCDAESSAVVNNNAAAVLLVLNTLAAGKEVIVSHGQLVEIGGSFRLPDIITRSGAQLVAVGTTNRTRISDYRKAITDNTGVLMTAHTSNYRVQGFTEDAGMAELVDLGREFQLPVVFDLGGGILKDWSEWGLPPEPVAADSLRQGVSVVTFSGDKVLGGPQAGLIAGDKHIIQQVRRNPLMRALRCDKVTLAALEATLRLYLSPDQYRQQIPAWRMLTETVEEVRVRAETLANDLRNLDGADSFNINIRDTRAQAGSGTMPLETLPSVAITITPHKGSVEKVARRFGSSDIPVIGYLKDDTFLLDLKTVTVQEIAVLVEQAASVFASF